MRLSSLDKATTTSSSSDTSENSTRQPTPRPSSDPRVEDRDEQDKDVPSQEVGAGMDIDTNQPSGSEHPDLLPDKKRKRPVDGPSSDGPSPNREDGSAASPTGLNGSGGDIQSVVGTKTTKRLKVVPFKEYLGRHRAPKNAQGGNGRVPVDRSRLPGHIWRQIFMHSTPLTLARLSRVNRTFHNYLTTSARNQAISVTGGVSNVSQDETSPEAIWATSRILYFPNLPEPLHGYSEADMWRLFATKRCQFCGKYGQVRGDTSNEPSWGSGLGDNGIIVVWAFAVRSCAACLKVNCEKEVDVLISSSVPSALLAALPFIFLTPNVSVITASALQIATPPPTVQMAKYFLRQHVEDIQAQFDAVYQGPTATEEWLRGLPDVGIKRMDDAARWERWDFNGGLKSVLANLQNPNQSQPSQHDATAAEARNAIMVATNTSHRVTGDYDRTATDRPVHIKQEPNQSASNGFAALSNMVTSPNHTERLHPIQGTFQHPRVERSIREVNELKAARRSEIERRCSELDPPIPPSILNHMESFQNAMQISTPLTESAWAVLKPLLLAQRAAAEEKEEERIAQSRALQARYEERRQQDAQQREAKEALDREWDDAQAPIRELLTQYADDIIKDRYQDGQNLTNDTSPKFAADVLLYVRHRFYQHIAEEDAAAHAAGREVKRDPAKGPFTRKLILENMKWLFDTKIKPFTEQFRKELFLCHVCESSKFYGFEGVIQHYAAKHTNALSLGSIVVHWRAEWPEFSPFHPDPSAAKAAFYAIPAPIHTPGLHSGPPFHPPYPQAGYSQSPGPLNQYGRPGFPSFSPGPYGPVHYPGPHQHGPFAPPPSYAGSHPYPEPAPQGFPRDAASGYPPPHPGYHASPGVYQGSGPGFQGVNGPHHGPPPQTFPSPYPSQAYPMPIPGSVPPVGQGHAPMPAGVYNHPVGAGQPQIQPNGYHFQGPPPASAAPTVPGQTTNSTMYQTQLEEMVNIARRVWTGTSGIKDLPSSIRVYVVIQQVGFGFNDRFLNEPSLAMFVDGLTNHPAMKPMKNVSGLACKACATVGDASFHSRSSHPQTGDKKLYTLPILLNHFQTVHIERGPATRPPPKEASKFRLDWKHDMIELPETSVIAGLLHTSGMDDAKLHLIDQVFPGVFPKPLPFIGRANNAGPVPVVHEAGEAPRRDGRESWRFHDSGYIDSPRHGGNADHPQEHEPFDSKHSHPRRTSAYYASPPSTEVPEYHARDERLYGPPDRRPDSAYRHKPRRRYYDGPPDVEDEGRPHTLANSSSTRYEQDHPDRHAGRGRINASDHRYTAVIEQQEVKIDPRETRALSHSPGMLPNQVRADIHTGRASHLGTEIDKRTAHVGDTEVRSQGASPTAMQGVVIENREPFGEGSEDGEVGTNANKEKLDAGTKTGGDELSAAERFLNEFLPGDDAERHGRKVTEQERRDEVNSKEMRLGEREADNSGRRAMMEQDLEMHPKPNNSGRAILAQGNIRESPASYYAVPAEEEKAMPHPRGVIRDGQDYGAEAYARSPRLGRAPETDPRYLGNTVMIHDERHTVEAGRRPRSRYERYENLRHERVGVRSRSPRRSIQPNSEELRYSRGHVGDPRYERTYRAHSPIGVYHDEYPPESSRHHHSTQPVTRYRSYATDSRVYQPTYAVPMEYVPVRRVSARSPPPPPPSGAYVVEAQAGSYARYPAYGEEVPSRAVYDDRGQVYRVDRRIYHSDDSGRPSYQPPRY